MKIKLSFLGLIVVIVGPTAFAEDPKDLTSKDYTVSEVELLNAVFTNCPIQFIQAMEGAKTVGKASRTEDKHYSFSEYKITTMGFESNHDFIGYDVATLTITTKRDVPEAQPRAMDPAGTPWQVNCELVRHTK